MTPPASTICCAGCGYVADPADPYRFRCPQAGTDDADHVLTRVLNPTNARFPDGDEANPFLRYRALMHSYHVATSRAPADQPYRDPADRDPADRDPADRDPADRDPADRDPAYRDLVASLDASVAAVDGHGFRATPFARSRELSEALAFSANGGVWVKDETGNVSGSHKGRHLMGVLIHLAVMERSGLLDPARRRELAIASCGNAALAAAGVARAGGWRLTVFVPPEADAGLVARLRDLAATVVVCPREPGTLGDPAYLALR